MIHKPNRKTIRLRTWDYAADAWYFVTICTKDRRHFFGEAVDDVMRLSPIGEVAHQFWSEIPQHFRGVEIDAFVDMPNHVHGIIVINRHGMQIESTQQTNSPVGTRHGASLQTQPVLESANRFGPLRSGALPAIVNAYKSSVTRWCRQNGHAQFAWQPRYYEHILRSESALNKARDYIANNPMRWALDRENRSAAQ